MWESIQPLAKHLFATNDLEKLTALKEVCVEQGEFEAAANVRKLEKDLIAKQTQVLKVA